MAELSRPTETSVFLTDLPRAGSRSWKWTYFASRRRAVHSISCPLGYYGEPLDVLAGHGKTAVRRLPTARTWSW
ncbi:MAG TPA: hypothetical protein VFB50_15595 [Chloroflexota bacterium]|nr:hypothetical protein [Chloroflexota bacterium]